MASNMMSDTAASGEQNVRNYYREVLDNNKLPSLPVVASKVVEMIQDPGISIQKLSRLLADDVGLSARVLTVSRSPQYAQRNLPTTLLDGVQGFLTGLMHDVGQMILVQGDPAAYAKLGREIQQAPCAIVDKEQASYGLDHTLMGFTLLNSWNLDSQIAQAALNHHSDLQMDGGNKLSTILTVADYLCSKCGLGFFTEPASPAAEALAMCQCADDGSMSQVIEEIQEAYQAESELFKPA